MFWFQEKGTLFPLSTKHTCFISHFSGSEIRVRRFRSRVSSSTSGAFTRDRWLGLSGFLIEVSSLVSPTRFLLRFGFKSSPVSWSTSYIRSINQSALPKFHLSLTAAIPLTRKQWECFSERVLPMTANTLKNVILCWFFFFFFLVLWAK